ncbi:unnamed protein product, partial [Brenthis ino]
MSIQEVNGKGPKKRKKSLEICDNDQRAELNEGVREESEGGEFKNGGGSKVSRAEVSEGVELLHWRDMPQHLQFNPYVLTGYRPLQSWGGCVRSLFYFHNETINILTHGVSLVYMIAVLPGLLPWGGGGGGAGAWFLSLCHLLGALAPWCGSFLYHLFMNHTQGAALYHRLLQLDMLGIWVSQSIVPELYPNGLDLKRPLSTLTATFFFSKTIRRRGSLVYNSIFASENKGLKAIKTSQE